MWNNVANIPSFVPKAASVPAGSRNRPTSVPAGSRNRPTSVPAGRPFSAGWKNNVARPMTRPTSHYFQHFSRPGYYNHMNMDEGRWGTAENPHKNRDLGIVDSGCSRSMTGNKEKLDDFVKIVGGTVTFGGGDGRITGKGTIRTSKLNFENVYYVEELQNFNLFSVSQICDTKNKVLFTDKECLVLSKEFQLPENSQVVLRVPRRNNLYCFNLSDIKPERDVTCLLAKASLVESTKWHRRMAHVNFKNMNKLAKHGLVNGLPSKLFTNEHNCVACNKGKQHKASYKAITASDETYGILKDFITFIENQLTKKVKAIRCDNGIEFKNSKLIKLYGSKGIKRDYSNARTPQQNGVAERKNRTLIEAARTMLADSKLPTMFWTEAVSTACYVLNRVLVTRPHNKTPYELLSGKVPNISHLKPFGCLVTILNTSDHLGKFEGKADEGFIVGYAAHSKAYRVYNLSSKKIEETLNLRYLEDKHNVQGLGQEWYFDLDYLTDSLGYTRFKTNQPAGTQDPNIHAGTQDDSDSECDDQVIVVPSFPSNSFLGPKVHVASEMVESSSDYAEELARLQKQAYEANATAEKHLSQADLAASRNRVPTGKIDSAAGVSYGPTETSTPVFKPVHTDATSLPPGHSLGSSEHSTRYLSFYEVEKNSLLIRKYGKLCPLPDGKIAIWTKWILKNKRDARGIVVRNKARLVAQGHRQEEGIDYDESYESFVWSSSSTKGLFSPMRMDIIFWSTRRPSKCADFEVLHEGEFEMRVMGQVCQDRLKKLDMESVYRRQTTPFEASKPKSKDEPDDAVNVHLYRSMIVKKIFKYLKGQPKLGLWYPRDSPFVLEAYSDSDYAGSHGDRKSTTGGCQFLGRRLISWQCKKQTIVATSSTEAEYVAAANCCGQVLKIHTDENVADLLTKAFDGPSVFSGVARVPTGRTIPTGLVSFL
ncbi:putative ribonuclease H-like domain-containing protein [Tanacetum coccineum]|uniref:Ribonuclease H-like domain-containing protein n=1 Tax=Tanacetum coccineum TaxID=301880 RepID=A0ABQ5CUH7_9ASTR